MFKTPTKGSKPSTESALPGASSAPGTPTAAAAASASSAAALPSATKRYYKRFELLLISLGTPSEEVVGAPDVGILPVAVPGTVKENTRIGQHVAEGKILELIQAQTFDGVLIDSIFDTGVDLSREAFDGPVVGTFLPSCNQAALIGGRFCILIFGEGSDEAVGHLIRSLALRHGVGERLGNVQCVAANTLPAKEEEMVAAVTEMLLRLAKPVNAASCVVAGLHVAEKVNALLRSRNDTLVVIDSTLAGLNAIEGMMRQTLRPSRKVYTKSGSLKNLF